MSGHASVRAPLIPHPQSLSSNPNPRRRSNHGQNPPSESNQNLPIPLIAHTYIIIVEKTQSRTEEGTSRCFHRRTGWRAGGRQEGRNKEKATKKQNTRSNTTKRAYNYKSVKKKSSKYSSGWSLASIDGGRAITSSTDVEHHISKGRASSMPLQPQEINDIARAQETRSIGGKEGSPPSQRAWRYVSPVRCGTPGLRRLLGLPSNQPRKFKKKGQNQEISYTKQPNHY